MLWRPSESGKRSCSEGQQITCVGASILKLFFSRLEALFDGKDIQELIPPNYVNGSWIAENANFVPATSIKEYFEKNRRDFPTWVQSAMKNLSNCEFGVPNQKLLADAWLDFQGPRFQDLEKSILMLGLKKTSLWKL